jgi:hypothetical protein
MPSFIDMMASHRWTETDIINRTEAMIAAEFPPNQVAIINRIVTAAAAGMYQLTEEELAEVTRYNEVCLAAREAGASARADMALLAQVLDFEAAQQLVAAAAEEVVALAALRAPPLAVETPAWPAPDDLPAGDDEPAPAVS